VDQTAAYDDAPMLAQASAATVAASSTAALPVSVRRNSRSGVRGFCTDVVARHCTDSDERDCVIDRISTTRHYLVGARPDRGARDSAFARLHRPVGCLIRVRIL